MAERIREMAEMLSQKAEEIRQRLEGVDTNVNTQKHRRIGSEGKK